MMHFSHFLRSYEIFTCLSSVHHYDAFLSEEPSRCHLVCSVYGKHLLRTDQPRLCRLLRCRCRNSNHQHRDISDKWSCRSLSRGSDFWLSTGDRNRAYRRSKCRSSDGSRRCRQRIQHGHGIDSHHRSDWTRPRLSGFATRCLRARPVSYLEWFTYSGRTRRRQCSVRITDFGQFHRRFQFRRCPCQWCPDLQCCFGCVRRCRLRSPQLFQRHRHCQRTYHDRPRG